MNSATPPDVFIERRAELIEAEVDGELVALHVENGKCYGFNGTATRIWSLLERGKTLAELCEALSHEFNTGKGFQAEVMQLIRELEADGLVAVSAGQRATRAD